MNPTQRRMIAVMLWTLTTWYLAFQFTNNSPIAFPSNEIDEESDTVNSILENQLRTLQSDTNLTSNGKQGPMNEEQLIVSVLKKISNVPYDIWVKEKSKISSKSYKCGRYPNPTEIKFNNIYWQTLDTSNGTFYLYGAYYDNRALNKNGPSIRILGMINRVEPAVKTFCQLWINATDDPVIVPVVEYMYMWYKAWGQYRNGVLQPYLMTCHLPPALNSSVPISVSITEKECEAATNSLVVVHERPKAKKKFGVCVKGLDFLYLDLSVRLIEWIEMLTILGAEKIFMHALEVHPNVYKVLQYYENTGKIAVTHLTLPGEHPNLPGLRHMFHKAHVTTQSQCELIPYNDCLYRNLYRYEHLALIDIDEVILPKNATTWSELLDDLQSKALTKGNYTRDSFNFRNVYFWTDKNNSQPDIPHYMHMLQHTNRSVNYTRPGHYVKCFHNVERVFTLHNHYPLSCLSGGCTTFDVEPETAHLQHYRSDCAPELKPICESDLKANVVKDTTMWRYKEQLIRRVGEVLNKLGIDPTLQLS